VLVVFVVFIVFVRFVVTHKELLATTVVTLWVAQSCSTSLISTAPQGFNGSFHVETLPITSLHGKAIKKDLLALELKVFDKPQGSSLYKHTDGCISLFAHYASNTN
jgi:hypothetical protein